MMFAVQPTLFTRSSVPKYDIPAFLLLINFPRFWRTKPPYRLKFAGARGRKTVYVALFLFAVSVLSFVCVWLMSRPMNKKPLLTATSGNNLMKLNEKTSITWRYNRRLTRHGWACRRVSDAGKRQYSPADLSHDGARITSLKAFGSEVLRQGSRSAELFSMAVSQWCRGQGTGECDAECWWAMLFFTRQ